MTVERKTSMTSLKDSRRKRKTSKKLIFFKKRAHSLQFRYCIIAIQRQISEERNKRVRNACIWKLESTVRQGLFPLLSQVL